MTATRCTCIRDERLLQLVLDPTCPAWGLHARFVATGPGTHPRH